MINMNSKLEEALAFQTTTEQLYAINLDCSCHTVKHDVKVNSLQSREHFELGKLCIRKLRTLLNYRKNQAYISGVLKSVL